MNGLLVPNTQRKGGEGNRKEQSKRKNKKQDDWADRQRRQDSKKKERKKPKRLTTDSRLSENQRLIEEGLKAQREKDATLRLENQLVTQNLPITNSVSRTESLQWYKQQLYRNQQDLLFYQEDNSLPNLLKQLQRSETSFFYQLRTSAWSIHHRNFRSLYPVLYNRFKAITSFPIRSSRAQLSFHPAFGYLVSATGCLKYVSLSGVLIGEIIVQDQYHSIYWNQFDQKLGILAAISDYSITFYRICDNDIEMINQATFERNVENFHWLNDCEGITIIHDQIHKFTLEFPQSLLLPSALVSPDMIDLRIEKQFFRYKQATVSVIITFHQPQAKSPIIHQQLLLGLRNGSILLYDMLKGHGEVLHHMPYRITQLYQLKNNPLQYISKDISGNISLFDIRQRNRVSLVIRELNRIRLDLCTFYLTDDEEFLITSSGPAQIKEQCDQNTFNIQNNSTAARINTTINQDESKTIFSIYSLRHSCCSVFDVQASSFSEENSHQIPFNNSELILPSNSPCNAGAMLVREVNFINLLIYA